MSNPPLEQAARRLSKPEALILPYGLLLLLESLLRLLVNQHDFISYQCLIYRLKYAFPRNKPLSQLQPT